MNIASLSIKYFRFTLIATIVLLIYGVFGYLSIPRQEDPIVDPKECTVQVVYPGASPIDIENLILNPTEELFNEIPEVTEIGSFAFDGFALFHLLFDNNRDLDAKLEKVREKLAEAEGDYPEGVDRAYVYRWRTDRVAIFQVAVSSDKYSAFELETYCEEIKRAFQKVDNIRKVEIEGVQDRIVRVALKPERLKEYNLSLIGLYGLIASENADIPPGKLEIGPRKFNLRTNTRFRSAEDVRNLVVGAFGGQVLYLRDIAAIEYGAADVNYNTRYNGVRCLFVTVTQKPGTNILAIGEAIRKALGEIKPTLPSALSIDVVSDQAENVSARLGTFETNLLLGAGLISLLILAVMGFRTAVIIMTAIPLSVSISFGFMYLAGIAFEQVSIAALVISLGMIVDNAIIVTENIYKLRVRGADPATAVRQGVSQVGWAITSSTLTTIAAFIPILLVSDESGEFIRSIPITVSIMLVCSLFVAVVVTPLVSYWSLRSEASLRKNRFTLAVDRFTETGYTRFLTRALRFRKSTLLISVMTLAAAAALFMTIGIEFFPKADRSQFLIQIRLPQGSRLEQTDQLCRSVEKILGTEKEVSGFASNVGRGNPVIYYNMVRPEVATNFAEILVNVAPDIEEEKRSKLIQKLRRAFSQISGARIELIQFEQGPVIGAPIAIRVTGRDLGRLKQAAGQVEAVLKKIPGTIDIRNEMDFVPSELSVTVNKEKARVLGLSTLDVARSLRLSMSGEVVTSFIEESRTIDVFLKLGHDTLRGIERLEQVFVPSATGGQVPLSQISDYTIVPSYQSIVHRQLERTVTVRCDVDENTLVADVIAEFQEAGEDVKIPSGYALEITGETEKRDKAFRELFGSIIIAILAIYTILVVQFNSFSQPLVIFAALPLAVIGGVVSLFLTGYNFGFMAFVGAASLIGIVVNDSIVMVDYINYLRKKKQFALTDALLRAGQDRFIPIFLTTITTIGALLPLTLRGGALWAPMGWIIVGGILFATGLTLVVIPVLYALVASAEGPSSTE